jgi:hypothetical protein
MKPFKHNWFVDVGGSFFAPGRTSRSIQNDARLFHRPRKYKCRKIVFKGVVGVKVTRIA